MIISVLLLLYKLILSIVAAVFMSLCVCPNPYNVNLTGRENTFIYTHLNIVYY